MLNLNLLKGSVDKSMHHKLHACITREAFDTTTLTLFDAVTRYFDKYKNHDTIDWPSFLLLFHETIHPHIDDGQRAVYNQVIQAMQKPAPHGTVDCLLEDLQTAGLSVVLANAVASYNEGQDLDLPSAVQAAIDHWRVSTGTLDTAWNTTPIEELLDDLMDDEGLQWRIPSLRGCMRGLRGGHALIVGARPDAGKTSLLAAETTYLCPQLPEDRGVLWLNNEGTSREIIPRVWQAALDKTIDELVAMKNAGTLRNDYAKVIGHPDRIRVADVHGWSIAQCEDVIHKLNPGIVVWDMLDNIGFGKMGTGDKVSDLESLYQRTRDLAVIQNHVCLETSQVSVEGDGELFPRQSALKDSKTGKQGACDAIIMLGKSNDQTMTAVRGVSTPKNKLAKVGCPRDPRAQVLFRFDRARFEEMPTASELAQ